MMTNNLIIIFSFIFVIIFSVGYQTAYSQGEEIPKWVKSIALWWGQGEIEDEEFFSMIEFLLEKDIITVSNNRDIIPEEKSNQGDFTPLGFHAEQSPIFDFDQGVYSQLEPLHKKHDSILFQFGIIDYELLERISLNEAELDILYDEEEHNIENMSDREFSEWSGSEEYEELHIKIKTLWEQDDELRKETESNLSELTELQRKKLVQKLIPIYLQYNEIITDDVWSSDDFCVISDCHYAPFPMGSMSEFNGIGDYTFIFIDKDEYRFDDTIKIDTKLSPDDLLAKSMTVTIHLNGELPKSPESYGIKSCQDYIIGERIRYSLSCDYDGKDPDNYDETTTVYWNTIECDRADEEFVEQMSEHYIELGKFYRQDDNSLRECNVDADGNLSVDIKVDSNSFFVGEYRVSITIYPNMTYDYPSHLTHFSII